MSSPATADYPSLKLEFSPSTGAKTAASTWVDITQFLRRGTVFAGRAQESQSFQAATAAFWLDNRARTFDPLMSSGPFVGGLLPLRQIRLTVTWAGVDYPVGYWYADGWPQTPRAMGLDEEVVLTCTDGFVVLGRAHLPESVFALEVAADSPDRWYSLTEDRGTICGDQGSDKAHGVYEGGATFDHRQSLVPYGANGSIEFNGATDLIDLPPMLGGIDGVEFWIKTSQVPAGGMVTVMGFGADGTWFGMDSFGTLDGQGVVASVLTGVTFNDGQTHHVFMSTADCVIDGNTYTAASAHPITTVTTRDIMIGGAGTSGGSVNDTILFAGFLDEIVLYRSAPSAARAQAHYQAGVAPWDGDTAGVRIGRLLDSIGWPASLRDLDAGTSVLGPAVLGGNALEACQLVEQTEAGLFYMGPDGKAMFVSRTNLRSEARFTTSQGTFGDGPGEVPYSNIVTGGFDLVGLVNGARVARVGGAVQEYTDAVSQADYGHVYADDELGLLLATDGEAKDRATWKVLRYKDPHFRVDSITLMPRASPATAWPQCLGRKLGDRVTVVRRPMNVGAAISVDAHIESIAHEFAPLEWTTTFTLSAVDPGETLYWQIGAGLPRNRIGSARVGF